MKVTAVYLDDVLLYNATADEYGEDGEIVDVYAPSVPSHLANQIGDLVQVTLWYSECEEQRSGWMRFESVSEWLGSDAGVTMRFTEAATFPA
jgi:hypothetical protein